MSIFKRRWVKKLRLEVEGDADDEDDMQVAFKAGSNGEASSSVQVEPRVMVELEEVGKEREESEGEMSEQEVGDEKSLIPEEEGEEEIDSNGVVREYEVALKHLGFGFFHILLLFINGTALLSDAIEVLSISFVLPVLSEPEEYGAGDADEAILSSIIFVGMLFGSYVWGGLADVIGRRTTIVCSLTISALFGFASAFSPWFWLFVLLRFFSGFGVGGSLPVIFPYTSEFIRNKYRGPYLGAQSVFWMFGRLLCGGFAWAIIPVGSIDAPLGSFRFHSWRLFIAISALPSLIGAVIYFLLPESPRYLLEVGKEKAALRGLRLAHRLNHPCQSKEYPVKSILLETRKSGLFLRGKAKKLKLALNRCKEVLRRTLELFKLKYWRRTPLLLIIMFCLSFGGYGVTLWYPTYVAQVTAQNDLKEFEKFCNATVDNGTSLDLFRYCDCSRTIFSGFELTDFELKRFKINDVVFSNVSFVNVNFDSVMFNGTQFLDCQFHDSNFTQTFFNYTTFDSVLFDSVKMTSSSLCSVNGSAVEIQGSSMAWKNVDVNGNKNVSDSSGFKKLLNQKGQQDCSGNGYHLLKIIQCSPPDSRVYRDSFFISASAFPGNIASAFAVYFFRRNYWMAFVLFLSTISVFLLYAAASSELFVVIMLCIFNAVSTPAWNDSSLLIAELYPTHLRSTAAGIHLLMARIGAIIGTNLFGLFIRVNPSVPILFVAVILFTGAVTALGLPKTTRKTLLK